MKSLETLATVASKTVTAIMEPHKEVLQDMIPPKKHLLRHQPANAQIGLMVNFNLLSSSFPAIWLYFIFILLSLNHLLFQPTNETEVKRQFGCWSVGEMCLKLQPTILKTSKWNLLHMIPMKRRCDDIFFVWLDSGLKSCAPF